MLCAIDISTLNKTYLIDLIKKGNMNVSENKTIQHYIQTQIKAIEGQRFLEKGRLGILAFHEKKD